MCYYLQQIIIILILKAYIFNLQLSENCGLLNHICKLFYCFFSLTFKYTLVQFTLEDLIKEIDYRN